MGEIAYMDEKRREAIHWILSHPRREAQLFEQRFIATWLGTPHPLRDFIASDSFLIRTVFVANFLASLGALAGIVVLCWYRRMRLYALPVVVYPVVFPFAFYLSQALFRYRYPIDPVVLLLTAVAAQQLLRRFSPSGRAAAKVGSAANREAVA